MDPSTSAPTPDPGPAQPAAGEGIWLHRAGQTFGPYQHAELRAFIEEGRAGADDLVWRPGDAQWRLLRDIEPGPRTAEAPARFHHVAPWLFVLRSLATVGLYPFWWFWMSWREAARRQPIDPSGSKIMPFWRAFFSVFWFYPLCRQIQTDRSRTVTTMTAVAAVAFFAMTLCKRLPEPWWLVQVFSFVPALYPVWLVDRLNREHNCVSPARARVRFWHAPLILIGLALWLITLLDGLGIMPESRIVTGREMSHWHRSWLINQGLLEEGEETLYFYSAGWLWLSADGNLVTDRGLVSYYKENGEILSYRAPFEDIHRIEVQDASAWPEDTSLKVWTRDATADDEWFSLIFSPEQDLDNDVVNELRRRIGPEKIQLAKPATDPAP